MQDRSSQSCFARLPASALHFFLSQCRQKQPGSLRSPDCFCLPFFLLLCWSKGKQIFQISGNKKMRDRSSQSHFTHLTASASHFFFLYVGAKLECHLAICWSISLSWNKCLLHSLLPSQQLHLQYLVPQLCHNPS